MQRPHFLLVFQQCHRQRSALFQQWRQRCPCLQQIGEPSTQVDQIFWRCAPWPVQLLQDLAQDHGAGVVLALDRTLPQRVAVRPFDQDRRPLVGQQACGTVAVSPAQQAMAVLFLCLRAHLQHGRLARGGQHRPEPGMGGTDRRTITSQSPAAQVGFAHGEGAVLE
ncbi:hypothetical protein D3C73_822280 [compost metagenome]